MQSDQSRVASHVTSSRFLGLPVALTTLFVTEIVQRSPEHRLAVENSPEVMPMGHTNVDMNFPRKRGPLKPSHHHPPI